MMADQALTLGTLNDKPVRRFAEVLSSAPRFPLAVVLLVVLVAFLSPWLAPHDATLSELRASGRPPILVGGGSRQYLLGTDQQGRDVLSRIIVGARVSSVVALLSILFGGIVGTALGLLAGYFGGWLDTIIMRTVDISLAFPSVLLALIFAVSWGGGFWVVVIVLSLVLWARYARLVRGEVLSVRERDYVALARIAGASHARILAFHVLPNTLNSVVVLSTLQIGWTILVEASLSFLGAGIPPPTPTWGGMVAEGRKFIETLWWVSLFPGGAIMLVVLSFNMIGDWIRDVLDPKLTPL